MIAGDNARVNIDGTVVMTAFSGAGVFGDDIVNGDADQDRMYGQLGGDQLFGDADEDYVLGDLGFVTPGSPNGFWPGGAPDYDVSLELAPDLGGSDTIEGGAADDHLFGGAAVDTVEGGTGDDYIEGNGGSDELYGLAPDETTTEPDQDDMIGGSSSWTRPTVRRAPRRGRDPDAGQLRPRRDDRRQRRHRSHHHRRRHRMGCRRGDRGARKRVVTLLDREKINAALADVSGDDHLQGNDGSDRMFGEGGNDLAQGNAADDLIEGNQGEDWLEGNDGEDDVIGGSSFLASSGGVPLAGSGADLGDPDGADAVFGGAGATSRSATTPGGAQDRRQHGRLQRRPRGDRPFGAVLHHRPG